MNFRKRASDKSLEFQMTPMIDIMFLLLCFFLVVYVFSQMERQIDIKLPVSDNGKQEPRELTQIIINLDMEGTIYINGKVKTVEDIKQFLEIIQDKGGTRIIISADKQTDHGNVVQIMDLCKGAGIANINISTLPKE